MPLTSLLIRYLKFTLTNEETFAFAEEDPESSSPNQMWLMQALLLKSSLSVQNEAS
jgi:hypothetical protein